MAQRFSFGSYVPGCSPIHKANAQVKIVLACAFSVSVFFIDTWVGMGIVACALVVLYMVARVPLIKGLRGVGPIVFILLFTVLVHALNFTLAGLLDGLFVAARIALLAIACMLLTFTTSSVELTAGMTRLLLPLRMLKVPVDDLALVISLALRFIPLTADEAYAIRRAQMARGADFESGSLLSRVRAWGRVLTPLIVRLFLQAEELARALDARCYNGAVSRSAGGEKAGIRSIACLVVFLAALVALCIFL